MGNDRWYESDFLWQNIMLSRIVEEGAPANITHGKSQPTNPTWTKTFKRKSISNVMLKWRRCSKFLVKTAKTIQFLVRNRKQKVWLRLCEQWDMKWSDLVTVPSVPVLHPTKAEFYHVKICCNHTLWDRGQIISWLQPQYLRLLTGYKCR